MIINAIDEFQKMLRGLKSGAYPSFVFGAKILDEIPIFSFHRVDPEEFDKKLNYLKKNGYTTLTADELLIQNCLRKTIVLTFDDGLENFYKTAFPILKKYDYKAILFIIPAWIGKPGLLTWDQIYEMSDSGLVDIQSHSYHHKAIAIAPKIIDYFNPKYKYYRNWNLPVYKMAGKDRYFELPHYGTPIFQFGSRLGEGIRYFPDKEVFQAYINYIKYNGGEDFFKKKNWRKILNNIKVPLKNGKYETCRDRKKEIQKEIFDSKLIIEEYLPGKTVRHFSLPWNETSRYADVIFKNAGFVGIFGGLLAKKIKIDFESELSYFRRISGDFIFCLPGKGRKSLFEIFFKKIYRRIRFGLNY